jgi:hypothetical protein
MFLPLRERIDSYYIHCLIQYLPVLILLLDSNLLGLLKLLQFLLITALICSLPFKSKSAHLLDQNLADWTAIFITRFSYYSQQVLDILCVYITYFVFSSNSSISDKKTIISAGFFLHNVSNIFGL